MVRSTSIASLEPLKARVAACLEAGAVAAGCEVDIAWKAVVYADMLDNEAMVSLYAANAAALGRPVAEPHGEAAVVGSTDMGNVSYLVPSIHPMIAAAPSGLPDPHARVRQPRPVRSRATGRWSTAPWPWPGRSPTSGPGGRPRGRAGRVRRHHRAGRDGVPTVRDRGGGAIREVGTK